MVDVLIPSFLEVPFGTLVNRIDDGSRGLLELASLLAEQHSLQEKDILYALKVGRSNVFDHEIEASTTERMLGFYKNYYLYLYKANMQHHKDYSEQILLNLEQLKSKRGSRVIHTKQSIQQDLKNVATAKENLDKAKKVLQKAKADHLRAVDKLCGFEKTLADFQRISEEKAREATSRESINKFSVGRMLSQAFESNPEQDRDRQIRKVAKRKNEVIAARQGIHQRRKELLNAYRVLDENYQKSSLLFQDMELERMYTLKNTFKSFCDLEKQFLTHRLELLKTLEEAVTMQQPEEDVALYISQGKQTEWTHKYCHALGLLEERLKDSPEEDDFEGIEDHMYKPPAASAVPPLLSTHTPPSSMHNVKDVLAAVQGENEDEEDAEVDAAAADASNREEAAIHAKIAALSDLVEKVFNWPAKNSSDGDHAAGEDSHDWATVFDSKEARDTFLMELDKRRGKSALLPHQAYCMMSEAMKAFLDICEDTGDVMSAMRITNMANTFHESAKSVENAAESQEHDPNSQDNSPPANPNLVTDTARTYLHSSPVIRGHSIWNKEGFWEAALRESVLAELNRSPPILWPDLPPEELREAVVSVHNIVFGQLGSLSFVMQQQGMPDEQIVQYITQLSRLAQLPEDQEFQLICSITGQKVKDYQPPPALPQPLPPSTLPPDIQGLVVKVHAGDGAASAGIGVGVVLSDGGEAVAGQVVAATVVSSSSSPMRKGEAVVVDSSASMTAAAATVVSPIEPAATANKTSASISTLPSAPATAAAVVAAGEAAEKDGAETGNGSGANVSSSSGLPSLSYMQSFSSKFFSRTSSSSSTSGGVRQVPRDTEDDFAEL